MGIISNPTLKAFISGRISRRLRFIIIFIMSAICLHVLITLLFDMSENDVNTVYEDPPVRGVVVTLVRSTPHSVFLTMNMMHSFLHFHRPNSTYLYPFLIFHDEKFTSAMRKQILSCIRKAHKHIKISFASVNLTTNITINPGSSAYKTIAYRLMCRFWIYDVFYHPAIIQGNYDYLMRMDDDSYLTDVINYDIFLNVKSQKLDYAFRTTYAEKTPAMDAVFNNYRRVTDLIHLGCIYNNFFVIRLQWFYEATQVHQFLRDLIKDNLILREYIGDGCVHAKMLLLENNVKFERLTNIPYGHNFHLLPPGYQQASYQGIDAFYDQMNKSCHQFTILSGKLGDIVRIKVS